MKRVLDSSRDRSLLADVSLVAASAGALVWGTFSAFDVLFHLIERMGNPPLLSVDLVALMGKLLLASALLLFAVGLPELFHGEWSIPAWLEIRNLHGLKTRLAYLVILVMAVTFVENWIEWTDPKNMLYFAGASVLDSSALITLAQSWEEE